VEWTDANLEGRDRRTNDKGYLEVWYPEHPSNKDGYVLEHRLVMEKWLRRYLHSEEVVHHVNENKKDNRIENLWLTDEVEHAKIHRMGKMVSQAQRAKVRKKQMRNTMNAKRDQFGRYVKSDDNTTKSD
jgi:HNH endonuclease